ncbi:pyruvate carboxylase subunit B [Archaeoglobus sp.]
MKLKDEIIKALEELFKDAKDYEKLQWELDNVIYPYIGNYIANGILSKEEGKEIFEFCERKLKELKDQRVQPSSS